MEKPEQPDIWNDRTCETTGHMEPPERQNDRNDRNAVTTGEPGITGMFSAPIF